MLPPISLFLQGSAFGLTAGATPGPLQTYMISETLSGGWRRSFPLIFVPIISDAPAIIITTFILKQFPAWLIQIISLVGGIFVFYMAWGLWKQWKTPTDTQSKEPDFPHRSIRRAVMMNLFNPNPYIFWALVIGPILINAINQSWLRAALFVIGFYGVFLGTMLGTIILFHQTRRLGPKVVHTIQLFSIIILVIFGTILIKEGIFS